MKKNNPNPPARHHFVPRCYLTKFMDGDHLFILDLLNVLNGLKERPKESHPNKICLDENFYKIKSEHQHTNFKLEEYDGLYVESTVLHEVENKYNNAFERLISGGALPMETAVYFSDFMIQMKIRNPYWLNNVIAKNKDKWIDDCIQQLILEDKGKIDSIFNRLPEEWQKFAVELVRSEQKGNKTFEKQMQLFGLIQRSGGDNERNEKYRDVIVNSKWQLWIAPENGPFFITSDNPGFARDIFGQTYNSYFTGESVFYIPMAPQYCLVIDGINRDNSYKDQRAEKEVQTLTVTAVQVISLNNYVYKNINKLLIGYDKVYLSQIVELNPKPLNKTGKLKI